MLLEFNPAKSTYFLRVPRGSADVKMLVREQGYNFSTSASTTAEAVLFTREPYAAAQYFDVGTPAAQASLVDIQREVARSYQISSKANIKCPADKELSPFQKAGVEYALRRNNTLIGDQPGLGKTMQAICYANEIGAKRILVVCPANIRLQWCNFIREWTTMKWPYLVYPILSGKSGVHPTANWTIVSYDLARSETIGAALARNTYDLMILDEAHYAKTIDSGRTRAIFGGGDNPPFPALVGRCGSVLGLTGTPLPNRPRECYTLARGMCFDAIDWMSEEKFTLRFNPSSVETGTRRDGSEYTFIREESGRHGELQARLRANFMVRRLKKDVMPQLKLPVFSILHVEETAEVKKALQAERMLDIDPEHLEGIDATVMGHIAVVRRQMGIALAPEVAKYVKMILDGGEEKVVLFGWHIAVLDIWQEALRPYGFIRVDGRTSPANKQAAVKQFIENPRMRVFGGNLQSIGTGTDGLQKVCSHALFGECSWAPGDNEQGVDRLNRMGQDGQVQADFLVAPGSLAEKILGSSLRKLRTTDKVLDRRFSVA